MGLYFPRRVASLEKQLSFFFFRVASLESHLFSFPESYLPGKRLFYYFPWPLLVFLSSPITRVLPCKWGCPIPNSNCQLLLSTFSFPAPILFFHFHSLPFFVFLAITAPQGRGGRSEPATDWKPMDLQAISCPCCYVCWERSKAALSPIDDRTDRSSIAQHWSLLFLGALGLSCLGWLFALHWSCPCPCLCALSVVRMADFQPTFCF